MSISEFTLLDFLTYFIEYAVRERSVRSFSPPFSRPWHEFLWNVRCVFHDARLPYIYLGAFDFGDRFPKSLDLPKAMSMLETRWVCYARLPDWRIVMYQETLRARYLPFVRDPVLEKSLDTAYAVAINIKDLLEL